MNKFEKIERLFQTQIKINQIEKKIEKLKEEITEWVIKGQELEMYLKKLHAQPID